MSNRSNGPAADTKPDTAPDDKAEIARLRAELADAQAVKTDPAAAPADDEPDPLLGRLALATGRVVAVPAVGCQAVTHHYDDEAKATVPVVSSFVLAQD